MALTELGRDVSIEHYHPNTVGPSKEFKTLAGIMNGEYSQLWSRLWKLFANTFVMDIDEDGASRWEQMLKLYPPQGASLEDRRREILIRINNITPYTHRSVQNMLDTVYGEGNISIYPDYDSYNLILKFTDAGVLVSESALRFLRVVIPANLGYGLRIERTVDADIRAGIINGSLGHKTIDIGFPSCHEHKSFVASIQRRSSDIRIGIAKPTEINSQGRIGFASCILGTKYIKGAR